MFVEGNSPARHIKRCRAGKIRLHIKSPQMKRKHGNKYLVARSTTTHD